jgi:hypothetical protein
MDRAAMAVDQSRYDLHCRIIILLGVFGSDHRYHGHRLLSAAQEKDQAYTPVPDHRLLLLLLERIQLAGNTRMDLWVGPHHRRTRYYMAFLVGFFISAAVFYGLNVIFPVANMDQMDAVDVYGTFTLNEARRIGVAPLEENPSSLGTSIKTDLPEEKAVDERGN